MKINRRILSLSLVIISLFVCSVSVNHIEAQTDVNILCFVANGFGDSYHINKGIMESYNWTVTTSGTTDYVFGCNNNGKDVNDTYTDVRVNDIADEDISNYDCVFVPSGGHWANVISISRMLEIIQVANEQGILVAGICTGMIVLAYADVLEDVEVAYNIHALEYLNAAGANMTGYPVVSDQGVITGGFGGGTGSGPEGAPNEAFCEKIKEEIESLTAAQFSTFFVIAISVISLSVIALRRKDTKR
ncbi:MAG: DJ-1/PfpI family protein [Candidatus Heimdallarchaeaceae archaeon]